MSPAYTRSILLLTAACAIFTSAVAAPRPRPWAPAQVTTTTIAAATAESPLEEDADLPGFALGTGVDKEAYLQARNSYYEARRGPAEVAVPGLVNAVKAMKTQAAGLGPFISSTWSAIGPFPIPNGQTTSIQTAVSGRVTAIAVHPTNPNIVYVGNAQGGVWRSLNGGTTWTPIFDGAASLAIGALALAPSNPTILYVGTGESNGSCDSYFGVGLYRIDNADTAPTLVGPINPPVTTAIAGTTAFTGRTISKILVDPTNAATIFVATASGIGGIGCNALSTTVPPLALRGIYRSTNATSGSPSFQKLTVTTFGSIAPDVTGNRTISDMVYDPGDATNNTIVCWVLGNAVAGDGGIFRTTNALAPSPTFAQTFLTTVSASRAALAVNRVGGVTTMIAGTGETGAGTGCTTGSGALRRSVDGGVTWSAKLAGGGGFCGGQCFYDLPVAIKPDNASVILIGGAGNGTCSRVYARSVDAGATFTGAGGADVGLHADAHAIEFAPSNTNIVYEGNDGGIYRSNDAGATWTSLNTAGFSATQFQSLALHPTDPKFTIGGTQDNGTNWYRPNATWTRADFGDGGFTVIDQNAPDNTNVTMYHTYFNQTNAMGYSRVTTTANASDGLWTLYGCGFGGATANGFVCTGVTAIQFYAPMGRGPGNPNTLYFGSDRLYRSANAGVTMVTASQVPIVSGASITSIGVHPSNDNVRLIGLSNGTVWSTTTGAAVLTNVTGAIPARYVSRSILDPNSASRGWVALAGYGLPAGQHVWKTPDVTNGAGWVAAGNGIPDVPVNALVVDPLNSNTVYAGTDIGVYQTTDGGVNWTPFGAGLPVVAVFDMDIHAPSRVLRIATHGRGMWEIQLDNPTATEMSLVGTEIVGGKARLTWYTADGANEAVTLYRRSVPGDWAAVTQLTADGNGLITYEDADIVPGRSYEYGLASGTDATRLLGRVWVDVPTGLGLSLQRISPNPTSRGMRVTLVLPSGAPATLELLDITGRRVAVKDVGSLGAGVHDVSFDNVGIAAGNYWVRLTQSGRTAPTLRASIVR